MFRLGNYFFESFDYLEMNCYSKYSDDGSYKNYDFHFKFFKNGYCFVESERFPSEKELIDWYNSQVDKEFQQTLLIKTPKNKPLEEKLV